MVKIGIDALIWEGGLLDDLQNPKLGSLSLAANKHHGGGRGVSHLAFDGIAIEIFINMLV